MVRRGRSRVGLWNIGGIVRVNPKISDQIDAIMEGREPGAPKGWDDKSSTPPPSAKADEDGPEPTGKPADQLN